MNRRQRLGCMAAAVVPAFVLFGFTAEAAAEIHVVIDPFTTPAVRHAAAELATDIRRVVPGENVLVRTFSPGTHPADVTSILLGRPGVDAMLDGPAFRSGFPLLDTKLEPETFIIQSAGNSIVIGGADARGVLYGVYAFSERVLGIDPLEFWTGKKPPLREKLDIPAVAHVESPPVFGLRGYFDNDNDHLANWQGRKLIVEFDTWKAMIDSLARLRYNYIDIHDLLGRPEYYLRDYYVSMTDYRTDLELVERVIDYAHEKGLLVQIPMYLGWQFRHIGLDQVCLTEHHDLWMETYEYYLSETPIGKADLFLARPRHPVYDWEYHCQEEADKGIAHGPLLQRMFTDLRALIERYRPGAQLVTDLWQEGRALWVDGDFSPERDIQVLWADSGYAEFGGWPDDLQGYPMGIYVHAGVWHNQVVQDPYPARIGRAFRDAAQRGMTHNALVNGQSFKPFILNLEAAGRAMWSPETFDGKEFYREWTTRYFGSAASEQTVQSLEWLHRAHGETFGYRDVTKENRRILGKWTGGKAVEPDIAAIRNALEPARKSLEAARRAERNVPSGALDVFDDQVLFPITIYVQNLKLLEALAELDAVPGPDRNPGAARDRLATLLDSLNRGSRWKKWDGWYRPENFRIHTPPISLAEFDQAVEVSATQ